MELSKKHFKKYLLCFLFIAFLSLNINNFTLAQSPNTVSGGGATYSLETKDNFIKSTWKFFTVSVGDFIKSIFDTDKVEVTNTVPDSKNNYIINNKSITNIIEDTKEEAKVTSEINTNIKIITKYIQGPKGDKGDKGENVNSSVDTSSFVLKSFLSNQVDKIFDSMGRSTQGLSSSLSEEVVTELLTVSGNATIGGNITITGNITGNVVGTINPSFTLGSIPFQGATELAEDNANLFWDATNSRLGIGTATPTEKFNITGNILATGTILGSNLSGTNTGDNATNTQYSGLATSKQDALSGTGFVKITGTTISYDNSTYLTTSSASSTYLPLAGGTMTGGITNSTSVNPLTTSAESWIGPSSTTGIYFKDGNVGIGTETPGYKLTVSGGTTYNSDIRGISIEGNYLDLVNSHHPVRISSFHTLGAGKSIAGYDSNLTTNGSNNLGHIVSFQSRAEHDSSGTLAQMYGLYVGNTNNGGNLVDNYGIYLGDSIGTGTITNNYGLYIASLAKGGTLNYSIYTDGETYSRFGGNVGIGTSTVPNRRLTIDHATSPVIGMRVNGTETMVFGADVNGGYLQAKNNKTLTLYNDTYDLLTLTDNGAVRGDININVDNLKITGNVGIGTTDPSAQKLVVAGNVRVGTGTTGCIEDADGTVIAGTCSSDERLKKNITPFSSVLNRLVQLTPVTYNWRSDEFPERHLGDSLQTGLIAQEVEKQFPELVIKDNNGFEQITFQYLPFYLLQGLKELDLKVKDLSSFDVDISTSLWPLITKFLSEQVTNIRELIVDKLNINGDVCVDDVCVTKDQFKQILINAGGVSSENEDIESSEVDTENKNTETETGASVGGEDKSADGSSTIDGSQTTESFHLIL